MRLEVAEILEKGGAGDARALFAQMVPGQLGRHVTPIEVGRVVAFLLSDLGGDHPRPVDQCRRRRDALLSGRTDRDRQDGRGA